MASPDPSRARGGSGRLDDPFNSDGQCFNRSRTNSRCFSNALRLSSSAWSIDSAISEGWRVSSVYLTIHAGERSGPSIRRCARWLGQDAFVPERDSWICRKPSRFILTSWWLVKGHGRGQARIIVEVEARACPLRQLQNPWGCGGASVSTARVVCEAFGLGSCDGRHRLLFE